MFCQKCGAELSNTQKFCVRCGHKLKTEGRISNGALLIAGIAALISAGSVILSYWPGSSSAGTAATASPSPVASLSPSPTPRIIVVRTTPKSRQTQESKPTIDYLYKHTPTLIYPDDNTLFSYVYSSGKIVFRWKPVAESKADRYKVETEYGNASHSPPWPLREYETPWNYCTVGFADARTMEFKGRWRVTPIFADGRSGVPTEWRTFQFTR